MGSTPSAHQEPEICPRIRTRYLVAHRINDPERISEVLEAGANGIEIDLRSDGQTWYVNHDFAWGWTLPDYMSRVGELTEKPRVMMMDIKTPRAPNLLDLATWVTRYPEIQFIFGSQASSVQELLRLPVACVIAVDFAHWWGSVESVIALLDQDQRQYWLGDGNLPGLPKPSMKHRYPLFRQTRAQGTYGWTYSSLRALKHDMVELQLTMTTVNAALVSEAAALFNRCACGVEAAIKGSHCWKEVEQK